MYELIDAAARDVALVTKAGSPVSFVAYVESAESFSRIVWLNTETRRVFTTNEYGLVADRTQSASDVEFAMRPVPATRLPTPAGRSHPRDPDATNPSLITRVGWGTLLIVSLIILCLAIVLLTAPAVTGK